MLTFKEYYDVPDDELLARFAKRKGVTLEIEKPNHHTIYVKYLRRKTGTPMGMGAKVMLAVNKRADQKGKAVELHSVPSAVKFYGKLGFKPTDPEDMSYDPYEDAYLHPMKREYQRYMDKLVNKIRRSSGAKAKQLNEFGGLIGRWLAGRTKPRKKLERLIVKRSKPPASDDQIEKDMLRSKREWRAQWRDPERTKKFYDAYYGRIYEALRIKK